MSSTSDSANEFGIRQRLLAGVTCNLFAQRLTTLVAELRDSLEIIDADSRTFAKYRERDVYLECSPESHGRRAIPLRTLRPPQEQGGGR
jgi:hypothetical protein